MCGCVSSAAHPPSRLMQKLIIENYSIGSPTQIERIGSGLIHETYQVVTDRGEYVFQKLHPKLACPKIAQDLFAVTDHLGKKQACSPQGVHARDGRRLISNGKDTWRMQTLVRGQVFDHVKDRRTAYEAGKVLAQFHHALHDFERPFVSDFRLHETANELWALSDSVQSADKELLTDEILTMARFLLAKTPEYYLPQDLPLGVIHGDPKISNIIFARGQAKAMIDLDTCQRAPILLDLGDAFRDWCMKGSEDDLKFNRFIFESAWESYKKHNQSITDYEKTFVLQAVQLIALELASRFLADYFNDSYFGWDENLYPSRRAHNLVRAKGQVALYKSLTEQINNDTLCHD